MFQAAGDDLALYIAYDALGGMAYTRGQMQAMLDAYEQASAHARKAGHLPPGSFGACAFARFFGPTPVSELLAWLDDNEPRHGRSHFFRAYRAGALAMLGRFDEARSILAEARAELADRGGGALLANITAFESVWVELWAGDPDAAADFGAEGCRLHEELGDAGWVSYAAATLGRALYALDRLDEADAWAGRAAEHGPRRMTWRQVRAKVLARRGGHAEAEQLAREAVALGEETDRLDGQGDAYSDLAEVLLLGREARRRSRRARAGARALPAQGEPRVRRANEGTARRAGGTARRRLAGSLSRLHLLAERASHSRPAG